MEPNVDLSKILLFCFTYIVHPTFSCTYFPHILPMNAPSKLATHMAGTKQPVVG